ncbi:hypothetical protein BH09MYX1_BH09MYX1_11060 [soil metagenome]
MRRAAVQLAPGLVVGLSVVAFSCAHDLDAPPIGDGGNAVATPPSPFAKVDVPVGDGRCPQPIYPGYCRFRCRGWDEREESHHAQRIASPKRYALGTCGPYKAFAEEETTGGGVIELFDDAGAIVAAVDLRAEGCRTFAMSDTRTAIACTTHLDWTSAEAP